MSFFFFCISHILKVLGLKQNVPFYFFKYKTKKKRLSQSNRLETGSFLSCSALSCEDKLRGSQRCLRLGRCLGSIAMGSKPACCHSQHFPPLSNSWSGCSEGTLMAGYSHVCHPMENNHSGVCRSGGPEPWRAAVREEPEIWAPAGLPLLVSFSFFKQTTEVFGQRLKFSVLLRRSCPKCSLKTTAGASHSDIPPGTARWRNCFCSLNTSCLVDHRPAVAGVTQPPHPWTESSQHNLLGFSTTSRG